MHFSVVDNEMMSELLYFQQSCTQMCNIIVNFSTTLQCLQTKQKKHWNCFRESYSNICEKSALFKVAKKKSDKHCKS